MPALRGPAGTSTSSRALHAAAAGGAGRRNATTSNSQTTLLTGAVTAAALPLDLYRPNLQQVSRQIPRRGHSER